MFEDKKTDTNAVKQAEDIPKVEQQSDKGARDIGENIRGLA